MAPWYVNGGTVTSLAVPIKPNTHIGGPSALIARVDLKRKGPRTGGGASRTQVRRVLGGACGCLVLVSSLFTRPHIHGHVREKIKLYGNGAQEWVLGDLKPLGPFEAASIAGAFPVFPFLQPDRGQIPHSRHTIYHFTVQRTT